MSPGQGDAPPVLLRARALSRSFAASGREGRGRNRLPAVDGVDLELRSGEILGLVGESGSGKTTLGRLLVRLLTPTGGELWFRDGDLLALRGRALRRQRRDFQMVFQDPVGSMNPMMTVGEAVAEPLRIHRALRGVALLDEVERLLRVVGMEGSARRYPNELSGGQRQRVSIARALAPGPKLVVADEPTSALDVSTQAQILDLLRSLRERFALALMFISHDLALVRELADRIAVMLDGRIVEELPRESWSTPAHPFTRSLVAASRTARLRGTESTGPAVGEEPEPGGGAADAAARRAHLARSGCTYVDRCRLAHESCALQRPALELVGAGHRVACPYWREDPRSASRSAPRG